MYSLISDSAILDRNERKSVKSRQVTNEDRLYVQRALYRYGYVHLKDKESHQYL